MFKPSVESVLCLIVKSVEWPPSKGRCVSICG